jgi:hypothetical protein
MSISDKILDILNQAAKLAGEETNKAAQKAGGDDVVEVEETKTDKTEPADVSKETPVPSPGQPVEPVPVDDNKATEEEVIEVASQIVEEVVEDAVEEVVQPVVDELLIYKQFLKHGVTDATIIQKTVDMVKTNNHEHLVSLIAELSKQTVPGGTKIEETKAKPEGKKPKKKLVY